MTTNINLNVQSWFCLVYRPLWLCFHVILLYFSSLWKRDNLSKMRNGATITSKYWQSIFSIMLNNHSIMSEGIINDVNYVNDGITNDTNATDFPDYDINDSFSHFEWGELAPVLVVYSLTFILGLVGEFNRSYF